MGKIDSKQGSEKWKALRRTKITASDASIILGVNPFKKPWQLFDEKIGFGFEIENDKMKAGSALEPLARLKYIERTGRDDSPEVWVSGEYPWMMASLDGITEDGLNLVEIKCGARSYKQAEDGLIPEYYLAQCQHQMYVCGIEIMDYWAFNGTDGILIEVVRDEKFIENMIIQEKQFYDDLINLRPPS